MQEDRIVFHVPRILHPNRVMVWVQNSGAVTLSEYVTARPYSLGGDVAEVPRMISGIGVPVISREEDQADQLPGHVL